jgi:hypothetical protein
MCSNETYNTIRIGKHLSDSFPIQNGRKQGDALSPLLFSFVLEYVIKKAQENQLRLKLNGTYRVLAFAESTGIETSVFSSPV